jgi:hypothetical protein
VILILASPLVGSSAIARFSTATNSRAQYGQDTLASRIRTYERAWRRIRTEPFLGTGLDAQSAEIYDEQNRMYYPVHNLFLGRWYDSGLLGLAGILVLVGTLWRLGWLQVSSSVDRYLALALLAGFIAYIGDDMSEPSLYKRFSLVPALLIVALGRVSSSTVAMREQSEHELPMDPIILDGPSIEPEPVAS